MKNLSQKDKIIYQKVHSEIITHELYNQKYFTTFEEFLIFCEEKQTDITDDSGSLNIVLLTRNQFKKIIAKKISEYYLSTDNDGNPNPPITYWKYVYRR